MIQLVLSSFDIQLTYLVQSWHKKFQTIADFVFGCIWLAILLCAVFRYHMPLDMYWYFDALNIKKAHIVGHDWGSALAWPFAGYYPERTMQLVAISVGHPAGYMRGDHRGEQKQKS